MDRNTVAAIIQQLDDNQMRIEAHDCALIAPSEDVSEVVIIARIPKPDTITHLKAISVCKHAFPLS